MIGFTTIRISRRIFYLIDELRQGEESNNDTITRIIDNYKRDVKKGRTEIICGKR